jgi:hypothetical protein
VGDGTQILWAIILGAIGMGYVTYGRRQKAVAPLLVGFVLVALPWLVTETGWLIGIGAVLLVLPYFVRI